MEKWKKLSIRDDYEVSNYGRIRRKKRGLARDRKYADEYSYPKFYKEKGGYYRVNFFVNDKRTVFLVHRLVAIEWIPNPMNKAEVNHKDGNKSNNHVSNLEWNTKSENQYHSYHRLNNKQITNWR